MNVHWDCTIRLCHTEPSHTNLLVAAKTWSAKSNSSCSSVARACINGLSLSSIELRTISRPQIKIGPMINNTKLINL